MHYLTLDTNTWIYLANGTEPARLLAFIQEEVKRGNITILIPETVIAEWNKNKDKAVKQGVLKHYNEINESLDRILKLLGARGERDPFDFLLDDHDDDYFNNFIEKFKEKKNEIEEAISDNIKLIDQLFAESSTIRIKISDAIKLKAAQFALEKKAPFKNKNSFADAVIVFSFIDYVQSKSIDGAWFITYNTDDFCEKKDGKKYLLHPDLQADFDKSKSKFYTIVGEALNTIKNNILSEEELERIKEQQEAAKYEDDIVYCKECEESHHFNEVHFSAEPLYDERKPKVYLDPNQTEFEFTKSIPKIEPAPKYFDTIEVGYCNWCSTIHFICVECGSLNSVLEYQYNKPKECEGGCGLEYFIDSTWDKDEMGEGYIYKLLKDTETCEKCGKEYEDDGSNNNICPECEEEYAYGIK